jgi:hypothetical protein
VSGGIAAVSNSEPVRIPEVCFANRITGIAFPEFGYRNRFSRMVFPECGFAIGVSVTRTGLLASLTTDAEQRISNMTES